MSKTLFSFDNATIETRDKKILHGVTWTLNRGDAWLLTGGNGSGKSALAASLAGQLDILQQGSEPVADTTLPRTTLASFEEAARLIREERYRDDSDFVEGGVDPGRTPADILELDNPEQHPAVIQCGITKILHRGLKYLSTGEIRRTLLAKTLTSQADIIILDEPFDGLDTLSREELAYIIEAIAKNSGQTLIIVQDREAGIPDAVDRVLSLRAGTVAFVGSRAAFREYTAAQQPARGQPPAGVQQPATSLSPAGEMTEPELPEGRVFDEGGDIRTPLVEMRNVTVEWSGNRVLDNLSWTLFPGQHWLIRGPNGSGKTTFLELITGDNPQVFKNDVRLFGRRRGSGETIWEIKARLGIVSWRLHQEYRMTGDLDLEGVLLSGLHDSIGLYEKRTDEQRRLAEKWLSLAELAEQRESSFSSLSYGQQRAVLILRAAIKRPPVLILDEPCHGLDTDHRAFVLALLERIAATGSSTLLHVTHDPEEVLPCEKHILELRPGESPMWYVISRK